MYASDATLQFIPNMDGFPNGRRLEDDVTRIELQAVGGVALAAIGLWYDDFNASNANQSPVTNQLVNVLQYSTGVEGNDAAFKTTFPYVASPLKERTSDPYGSTPSAPAKETIEPATNLLAAATLLLSTSIVMASSHRGHQRLQRPLADNTDVYAFRSPDDPNSIIIIINYVPMQLPYMADRTTTPSEGTSATRYTSTTM